ncbi:alpha/beta hydrolase family protein [Pseudoxanthomonas suwonensis]|uniref:alpha/beta hydrolase family protein n=1 Tax=Pseudoxanthomonas suwonensis TaxID=314722 RepID=UPI000465C497|nr:S9 family peptidase [Pseudoxanthomonas suwonensis]
MRVLNGILLLVLLACASAASAREVPIRDFFKDPEFTSVSISPDGKHMAITVPQEDRTVLAVLRVSDKGVVGKWDYGPNRHFSQVLWANNERLLFYVNFKTGRFDFQTSKGDLYASNIDGTQRIDIPNGAYYNIVSLTPEDPRTILVERSIEASYLSKLDVYNGRLVTVASAPVEMGSFLVDHDRNVRFVSGTMFDGRNVTYRRDGEKWTLVHESERNGATYFPLGFAGDNRRVYMAKGEQGKPESIVLLDTETREETQLSNNGTVSPSGYLWSADRKTLLGVWYEDGIPYWDWIAPEHPETKVYAGLVKAFPGKAVRFLRPSDDGRYLAMRVYADTMPSEAFLFDRESGKATFLAGSMEWIKPAEMSPMKPVAFKARDGLQLHGYITIPAGSDGRKLPLIVNPHGGPHGPRDEWGFNPEVQLFANRGFAVLQINYRGSGGYGNAFEGMGYRKWGTTMQDDLTDGVRWAIAQGIADPDRVCIYGASYGGYAALMSAVREPDLYRCTVGYVGVYDLDAQRDADFADHEYGRNYLKDVYPPSKGERVAQSPAYGVERLKAPVMLVHGAKDVRVPIKNMNFLVSQMAKVGKKPEEVVVEAKEGHGFRDVENNVNLYTKMLAFFDKYIGPGAKVSTAGTP